MKKALKKNDGSALDPETLLASWIDRLDAKHRQVFRAVRTALQKRFPTANELAYDYTTHVVIGYAPGEHGIAAVVALTGRDTGVSLYFGQGPKLPDPSGILKGSGKMVRFVELDSARRLASPEVAALIAAAIAQAKTPLPVSGKGHLMVKSSSAAQRAKRTAKK